MTLLVIFVSYIMDRNIMDRNIMDRNYGQHGLSATKLLTRLVNKAGEYNLTTTPDLVRNILYNPAGYSLNERKAALNKRRSGGTGFRAKYRKRHFNASEPKSLKSSLKKILKESVV
jgi:hypothetical protein